MARQVFLSYSSKDATDAQRICAALESGGISCWMAPRDVEAGTDYPAEIVDAITSSTMFLVLVTDHSVASRHVLSEVEHAFNAGKPTLPFRATSVPLSKELDYFLSMAQWLDATDGCTDQNLQRLVAAARASLSGDDPAPYRPEPRSIKVKRLALLALVPLIGGIAYWKWPHATTPIPAPVPAASVSKDVPPPAATTRVNPKDGAVYVSIPHGTFTMGCSASDSQCAEDERPAHPVEIPLDFWLARTEVTNAAFRKYAANHGLKYPPGSDNLPATSLTWAEAKSYCIEIGGRLPTEAEWEYAARGGKTDAYYGPLPAIAWYSENSGDTPHAVGSKAPNGYGLHDMLGNVSEWVLDRYYNKYDLAAPATGSDIDQPLAPNASAVARGGFWDGDAATIRVSHRAGHPNDAAEPIVGFRCAADHL